MMVGLSWATFTELFGQLQRSADSARIWAMVEPEQAASTSNDATIASERRPSHEAQLLVRAKTLAQFNGRTRVR